MKGTFTGAALRVLPCPQVSADGIYLEASACSTGTKKLTVTLQCSYLVIYLAKEDRVHPVFTKGKQQADLAKNQVRDLLL